MVRLRIPTGAALCPALCALLLVTVHAYAQDQTPTLQEAISLFEDGEYLEAQEKLVGLDRAQLTSEQQARRDEYLGRVQVAITMYEKAFRDLEDAETALAEHEYERAEGLLERVIGNEYSAEALRRSAGAHLRDLEERAALVEEGAAAAAPDSAGQLAADQPETIGEYGTRDDVQAAPVESAPSGSSQTVARARALTREAEEKTRAGHFREALELYEQALRIVPGHPEAVDGIAVVRRHQENLARSGGQSLVDRIRRRDAVNWQRTVAQYRDTERTIREHVLSERFEQAQQMMARARQIVKSGRQFADPITKYENLRSELEALSSYVGSEGRRYHERKVAETRREIEAQRSRRQQQIEDTRTRQVSALMQQALQHRKDGDLKAAVNVLRQVTVIDPKHAPARWLMDILEDQRRYRMSREMRDDYYDQMRGALEDVERAKIPWFEELKYPKDWAELISRPGRGVSGHSRADRLLFSALDRPVQVDFKQDPFNQVIERLADARKLNIVVNWHDLKRAGVNPTAKIDLSLPREISLRKALTEVLEQASGGVADLGFDVADGVVTIASQQFLDQKTYPKVYDISDLLMEVPSFTDPPTMDLRKLYEEQLQSRVSSEADMPWRYGDDDDDEPEEDPRRQSRVRELIDLIQDIVTPDSWRDHGGSVGTIKEINNQLVITHNSAGHRSVTGLLTQLRKERAIQISVEALFITVSSHYLEELGMDLDIILNSGNAGLDFLDGGLGPVTDPVLGSNLLLPRTFSRLGFTPNTPALGTAVPPGNVALSQPYGRPYLVPQAGGASGRQMTPVPLLNNVLDFTNTANLPSDVPGSFAGKTIGPALSIFGSFLDNIQVDFLIRATQADSRSSVLTAPRLVVFNGGSAWVAVTIQQGFVAQLQPVVAQGAVAQQPTTGVIDAGASLFVRATVTADKRYVMMVLAPGVVRLLDLQTFQFSGGGFGGDAFIQLPTASVQRIQTMVSVPDGGTLLIGGQKLASETEVESGVPILSKIPILKRLYSSRAMVKDEQTLLILVKPKILIHTEQEEVAFPSFSQG